MLQLLVPISLDAFQEGSQGHLLLPSETPLLLFDNLLDLLSLAVSFLLLLDVALDVELFSFFVAL